MSKSPVCIGEPFPIAWDGVLEKLRRGAARSKMLEHCEVVEINGEECGVISYLTSEAELLPGTIVGRSIGRNRVTLRRNDDGEDVVGLLVQME